MRKFYIVSNKSDDYGNRTEELVETTVKNSREYYGIREVPEQDVEVLKKYFTFIPFDEEQQRSSDERYYGRE